MVMVEPEEPEHVNKGSKSHRNKEKGVKVPLSLL
jgi:hypothetical protein